MNITGKQMGIGAAALLVLSTTAGAVTNLEKLGLDVLLPASRGHVHEVAENLSAGQEQLKDQWIDLYEEKLFETELEQQKYEVEHGRSDQASELFESRKRTLRKKLKLLESKN
jgi:DNA-binding NtrC family response regulator